MSGAGRVRSRVRAQWLVLAAALVVLAAVLVAWALSSAAERVSVVAVARPVQAGAPLAAADLTLADIAIDAGTTGLVPASALEKLVGRTAAIDLAVGALVQVGMWRDAPLVGPGEETVGAVLPAGRYPASLARGDVALAAAIDDPAAAEAGGVEVQVRVVSLTTSNDGDLRVTLAVAETDSLVVARLAATGQLLLIGRPSAVVP